LSVWNLQKWVARHLAVSLKTKITTSVCLLLVGIFHIYGN